MYLPLQLSIVDEHDFLTCLYSDLSMFIYIHKSAIWIFSIILQENMILIKERNLKDNCFKSKAQKLNIHYNMQN